MKFLNITILSLVIFSCNNTPSAEQEKMEVSKPSEITNEKESLVMGELSEIYLGESIQVTGMIDVPPKNKASISTFVGGYVVNTPLLVGNKVSKGQVLVSLENPEYVELQQDYLELSEQLTYLESEYKRQKTLFDENISSEKSYLKAQSSYKSNLAHFNGLKKKLQMLNIKPQQVEEGMIVSKINLYAPVGGYINKINVNNGAYVSAQDVIMEIVDTEHIHLELSAFEKDVMKLKKGQRIEFQIPEASTKTFNATVHLVGTTIDESTRRVRIHGHVDNETNTFIVGMYVTAEIFLSDDLVPGLPKTAIINDESENFVFAVKKTETNEDSYEKIKVTLGKQNEKFVEIKNPQDLKGKTLVVAGMNVLE